MTTSHPRVQSMDSYLNPSRFSLPKDDFRVPVVTPVGPATVPLAQNSKGS